MIVAVCADKGAPGVTTLATALAMTWPGHALLLEADPSGGDLPFRARRPDGESLLAATPSVLTLAADVRTGPVTGGLLRYAQDTAWGVPVIQGAPGAAGFAPVRSMWPKVADEAARWPGAVVTDLGRLQPGSVVMPLARAATALVVLTRVTSESLYHLRERVIDLETSLGDPTLSANPVTIVVAAPARGTGAVDQVQRVLDAVGSPIPIAGRFALDEIGARDVADGLVTRRLTRGPLLRSAVEVADTLCRWWPELSQPLPDPVGEPAR